VVAGAWWTAYATFAHLATHVLADRTWFTNSTLFVGVTDINADLTIELPATGGKVADYSTTGRADLPAPSVTMPTPPALVTWQWRDAAPEVVLGPPRPACPASRAPVRFLAARGGSWTEPFGVDSGRMQGAAKRGIPEVFKRAATLQTVPKTPERRRGDFRHGLLGRRRLAAALKAPPW
jgi:hypothetical protein